MSKIGDIIQAFSADPDGYGCQVPVDENGDEVKDFVYAEDRFKEAIATMVKDIIGDGTIEETSPASPAIKTVGTVELVEQQLARARKAGLLLWLT